MASPPTLEFSNLSSAVSVYTPPHPPTSTSTASPTSNPTTTILCQWMGASSRSRSLSTTHQKYHTLYPTSTILTLRSLPSYFLSTPTSTRLEGFSPIVPVIDSAPTPRILVHLFSNGGALTFTDICTVYKRQTGKILPVQAIILDSAPGKPTIQQSWEALSIGMPRGWMWYPSAAVFAFLLGAGAVGRSVFGVYGLVYKTPGLLDDGTLVDGRAKRLYVFSEGDALVGWRDVEAHVEEFKKKGGEVMVLRERDTPHVQHITLDAERYWENVEELWRSTVPAT
ncbi:hypothetical protein ONS95_011701 [Cadophora gregata]|uniref:uncharacterized protein n=1 Tax=Cadophora gregata TaxID=51156 RepID=UPI0026DB74AE|nr:uncharacterized protein ONS95_011701 [Cadophora gregata]KAK0120295.1 hypothetical protein ONS95_011701 [Cadophora gregata]KAK0121328.1 hypothetical protein ONS96_011503 [Cadophora gregata f. sp. sojae]